MDPVKFFCPVCGEVFDTESKAIECRDQPFEDGGLKVGDIVVVPGQWTDWYDASDPWVAFEIPPDPKSNDQFDCERKMVPYYVVTAIHGKWRNPHRCVVTLVSLVSSALNAGWNPATGEYHDAMFRIDGGKHCDVDSVWIDTVEPYLNCKPCKQLLEEAAWLARLGISTRNLL
jgi:hypothetical protein